MSRLRYVSLFSGIEAATVAWHDLGFEPVAFAEIEPFCVEFLKHRYPSVKNLGDVSSVDWGKVLEEHGAIDVIIGGSPCQSFSIAGKREGLAGASGLMYEYIRAVQEVRPRWFVWENVPGALSSEKGEAFRQLLESMDDLGYGLAWRVLDAQFFGVAQRRRRVFLVGHLGDQRAAEILFEPDSLQWNPYPSKEKRKELTADPGGSADGVHGNAYTLKLRHTGSPNIGVGTGPLVQTDVSATLSTGNDQTLFQHAFSKTARPTFRGGAETYEETGLANTLNCWDVGDKRASEVVAVAMKASTPDIAVMTDTQSHAQLCVGAEALGTLSATMYKDPPVALTKEIARGGVIVVDRAAFNQGINAQYAPHIEQTDVMDTLVARGPHAVMVNERGGDGMDR